MYTYIDNSVLKHPLSDPVFCLKQELGFRKNPSKKKKKLGFTKRKENETGVKSVVGGINIALTTWELAQFPNCTSPSLAESLRPACVESGINLLVLKKIY